MEWNDEHTQFFKFIDDNTDAWLYLSNTPMSSALVSYPVHFHRLREHPNYWQSTRHFNFMKYFSTWAWDSCSSFPLPYFSAPGSCLFSNLRSRRIRRRETPALAQKFKFQISVYQTKMQSTCVCICLCLSWLKVPYPVSARNGFSLLLILLAWDTPFLTCKSPNSRSLPHPQNWGQNGRRISWTSEPGLRLWILCKWSPRTGLTSHIAAWTKDFNSELYF